MYKHASKLSGGTPLTGWSTRRATKPTDFNDEERKKHSKALRQQREINRMVMGYLLRIADAVANGRAVPLVPRRLRTILDPAIKEAGGVWKWAQAQSEFKPFPKERSKNKKRLT